MGDRQRLAVYDKVIPLDGAAECTICEAQRADCVAFQIRIALLKKTVVLCDSCHSHIMKLFSKEKSGDA